MIFTKEKTFNMRAEKTRKMKIHSYIDYAIATLLIFSPWIFNIQTELMESKIMVTVGLALFITNLTTKHKLGLAKIFKTKTHYKIDLFLGWFLFVSPFLYGFFSSTLLPHLLFGVLIFLNTFMIKIPFKIVSTRKFA